MINGGFWTFSWLTSDLPTELSIMVLLVPVSEYHVVKTDHQTL